MQISVVKAGADHISRVAELFDRYRVFYQQTSDLSLATEFVRARIENGESEVFLAIDEQTRGLGFTQLYPSFSSVSAQRIWVLNDLFVTPDARGLGVAKLLMMTAEQLAKRTMAKGIMLETAKDNRMAQQLYRHCGYREDKNHKTFFLNLETTEAISTS